jgi:hypothetical protein
VRISLPDTAAARALLAAITAEDGSGGVVRVEVPASPEVLAHEARVEFHEKACRVLILEAHRARRERRILDGDAVLHELIRTSEA